MRCVICKNGDTRPSTTHVALERGDTVLVIRQVPASVCLTCGESYIDANAFDRLQLASTTGIQVEVRACAPA